VSLAYASLAGLPPHYGIYCYLVGGLFYALFGTSRQLAIGPTSAISVLVGVTVAGMVQDDPARWAAIAALTALVMAAMCALVFRVESSLFYFNVEHVREAVWQEIRSIGEPLKLVVCDLSTSPAVDLAGARMLAALHTQLQASGIRLRLATAHAAVRDILRVEGLEECVGYFGRRNSLADVIDEFQGSTGR